MSKNIVCKVRIRYVLGGRIWLAAWLTLLTSANVAAQQLQAALEAFDKRQDVTTANHFFDELMKTGLTDEQIVFATDTPADSLCQQVWYWTAEWMYDQQRYDAAGEYAKKALPLYHGGNDERADCLNLLSLIYVRLGNVSTAAGYAKQCLEIDMRSGDDDRISSSLNTIAGIYMAGHQAKEAEKYILDAIKYAEKAHNPARQAVILGMASEIYHTLGDDRQALPFAERAYHIDSLMRREPQASIRLSQKGSALLGLHRYAEAEAIYRKVIPTLKASGDMHSYAIALNRMGMSLLCQERQREAIPFYQEAATLFSNSGDLYNEIHSHRGLYECYWKLDPDSARAELDVFDLLKDSLYTHAAAEALSRYNAEFGNDQLLQENADAHRAHRRTVVIAIALLLLTAFAAWLLVGRIRRRQQSQMRELVHEIERLRAGLDTESPLQEVAPTEEGQGVQAVSDEDQQLLMRVIEAVNVAMPKGNFGVEQIASDLNMSVQTFRRRLQNAAGETPKAYIQAIQMERASHLLTHRREMTVAEIASQCGFAETSSFGHTFKRLYGCSPSQYREKT